MNLVTCVAAVVVDTAGDGMIAIDTIALVYVTASAINGGIAIDAVASVTAIVVVARGVLNIGTGDRVAAFININEIMVIVVCSPTVIYSRKRRNRLQCKHCWDRLRHQNRCQDR